MQRPGACRAAEWDTLRAAVAQMATMQKRTAAARGEPGIGVEGAAALLFGPLTGCSALPGFSAAAALAAAGCSPPVELPTGHGPKRYVIH